MATMNRRDFNMSMLKGAGAAIAASAFPGSTAIGAADKRPNIVFICSDQHSFKYTGYMGHPFVKTPHMDRIAREGVVFENAYTTNPVCVPARSSLMTGMYASDCHSYCNSTVWDGSHPLWAKRLRDNGYHCWATGKLDLNDQFDTGFEEVDTDHGHASKPDITSLFRRPTIYRVDERDQVNGEPRVERGSDFHDAETALKYMHETVPTLDTPWAMYVGFLAPHPKFIGLQEYFDYYYPHRVDMPDVTPHELEELHLVYQNLRHFKRIATPISEDRIRRARAAYYALITELDEYIGRLVEGLEKTGQLENTIFIYTSDHGESLGDHGLWFKNNLYDCATRIPMIMMGPGIPAGKRIQTPVGHVDLAATLHDWAGIQRPQNLRGHSLLPMMHDKPGAHPGFAFCETHSEGNCTGSFMIRKGDWKYIHFTWYDDLLFNLKEDPAERKNRIDDPAVKGVSDELKAILNGIVDTETVTLQAFAAQETMLRDWSLRFSEKELTGKFQGRLGPGQAQGIAKLVKQRYLE